MNSNMPGVLATAARVAGAWLASSRAARCLALAALLSLPPVVDPSASAHAAHLADRTEYHAPHAATAPLVDGVADDAAWDGAKWHEIDQLWLGPEYPGSDFHGRFKVVTAEALVYGIMQLQKKIRRTGTIER